MPSSPKVDHEGLLVPNAIGLTYPRMAEPDQIDFATAANAQWGVIEGCQVTIATFTVMVDPGVVLVNGKMVVCSGGQVTLAGSMPQDRFDSIVINESGSVVLLGGTPAADPVFRDVPVNNTLLAVVFCPTGAESYSGFVIDKRRFVSKALLTKIPTTAPLVYNANGDGSGGTPYGGPGTGNCHFSMLGDGYMEWEGDTCLYRSAPETLYVKKHLQASGNIQAGGEVRGKKVKAFEEITGSNLYFEPNQPIGPLVPLGALHQNPINGQLSLHTATGWKELAVVDGIMPVGSIIQSYEPPSVMNPKGWVLLDGTVVSEADWPRLFTLQAFNFSGEVGSRTMILPNMNGRVLRGSNTLGVKKGGMDTITLTVDQMPRHRHSVGLQKGGGASQTTITSSRGGRHRHEITGGNHAHDVVDPGHGHNDGQWPAGAFVCLVWGGQNKIDALFNDRNHTYSVEAVHWTREATTGITVSTNGSGHGHNVSDEGDHSHQVTVDFPEHVHSLTESDMGQGLPIDITPAYLTSYFYIRA